MSRATYRHCAPFVVALLSLTFPTALDARAGAPGSPGARILVNGQEVASDVPPRSLGGTIFVPLRFVAEALGGDVRWNPRAQSATVRQGGRTVTVRVGTERAASVPARIIQGRVMVPLRAIGEALGASVRWEPATRTVAIHTAGTGMPGEPPMGNDRPPKAAPEVPLQVTVRADRNSYRAGEPVRLTLTAHNTSPAAVTLQMSSGQKFDFEVRRGDTVVWKWSDDRFFTQALVDVSIPPNQSLVFTETWNRRDRQGQPVPPDEYTIVGYLTARSVETPRAQTTIRILPAQNRP